MTEEAQNTISQISALIDSLTTQCNQLNKEEHKEQLVDLKQQIRKLENKLSAILPETKVPIGLNGSEKSLDRLKARAARFGVESEQVKKVVDDEKKSKRKERFNLDSGSEATSDDAKKRRLARFGGN